MTSYFTMPTIVRDPAIQHQNGSLTLDRLTAPIPRNGFRPSFLHAYQLPPGRCGELEGSCGSVLTDESKWEGTVLRYISSRGY
jgi:hypothetical protein